MQNLASSKRHPTSCYRGRSHKWKLAFMQGVMKILRVGHDHRTPSSIAIGSGMASARIA
jgi:hypothetical protein